MNWLAILVAAVAAVVLSTVYYTVFGRQMAALHPAYANPNAAPPKWKILVELVRSAVFATVIAWLASRHGSVTAGETIGLALALWVAFPLVLWSGSVVWENVPPKLAAIHAGDWLLKLMLVALIVGLWR